MSFIEKIKQAAKENIKTIVLPETSDMRTLKAAHMALEQNIAKVIPVSYTHLTLPTIYSV